MAIPRARQLLGKRDEEMVAAYQRQHGRERDLRFELVPGQQVLLRQRLPGKLRTKCDGPFVFLRSVCPNSAALELLGSNGKVRIASVGNVVPYRGSADREVSRPTKVRVLHASDLSRRGIVSVGYEPGQLEPRGPSQFDSSSGESSSGLSSDED